MLLSSHSPQHLTFPWPLEVEMIRAHVMSLSQADLLRRRGADIGGWRWNRACRHTGSLSELAVGVVTCGG